MSSYGEKCAKLDWPGLCHLYAQLLREAPQHLDLPARALREKARAGDVPVDAMPALTACIAGTDNSLVIVELAKACAALGRKAGMASPVLIEKMRSFLIGDDPEFWAFDGCLHALSHIGGDEAEINEYLNEIEEKPPVIRTGNLFQGSIETEVRAQLFVDSLAKVRARLAEEDPAPWTNRVSSLDSEVDVPEKPLPAWLASVR